MVLRLLMSAAGLKTH
ncbi:hypothetical protein ACSG8N_004678 [Cronobacter sakazakii]